VEKRDKRMAEKRIKSRIFLRRAASRDDARAAARLAVQLLKYHAGLDKYYIPSKTISPAKAYEVHFIKAMASKNKIILLAVAKNNSAADSAKKIKGPSTDKMSSKDKIIGFSTDKMSSKDKIIGFCHASITKLPPKFKIRKEGTIHDMFVLPEYRRAGIGQMLLNKAIEWLSSRNVRHLKIFVHHKNTLGQKAWAKYGFKTRLFVQGRRI
jgi:ribosomal protein S18 acetylase RimI-like enzyme